MTDETWSEQKLTAERFKKAIAIVDRYLKSGKTVEDSRLVYPDYPDDGLSFAYWRYKAMKQRWLAYIAKHNREPNFFYIKTPAQDISGDNKKLDISTVLDMETRVSKFTQNGGSLTPDQRIYLDMKKQDEYIRYSKYQDIINRVIDFKKKNGRNPNFVYIIAINKNPDTNNTNSKDVSKSDQSMTLARFKENQARVKKYLSDGGTLEPTKPIYINYPDMTEYISYSQYLNILGRYTEYVKKYNKEPNNIKIYVETTDVSNTGAKIPLETFLDMKARVDTYIAQGGNIADNRAIFLDLATQYDYVQYTEYLKMLKKYSDYVSKNKRQPNYISTSVPEQPKTESSTIKDKNCYHNPRWYSGTEMRQNTNWYCGCNMSQQILRELTGNFYSESYLARQLGTTRSGTEPNEIVSVLKKILKNDGFEVTQCKWVYLSDYSWNDIGKMIEDPKIGIGLHSQYKMKYGHYESPIKLCLSNQTITIAQSVSGGYIQTRGFATMKAYANAGSYPSLLIVKIK